MQINRYLGVIDMTKTAEDSKRTLLQSVLAILRAQHWLLYSLHWQAKGKSGYQLHLLFERLYGAVPAQFDALAEKMVNMLGESSVDSKETMALAVKCLTEWTSDNAVETALKSERALQDAIKKAYTALKASDSMSLGLDDYLMGLANEHETPIYLLEQLKKSEVGQSVEEKKAYANYAEFVKGAAATMQKQAGPLLTKILSGGKAVAKRTGELVTGSKAKQYWQAEEKLRLQHSLNPDHNGTWDAVNKVNAKGRVERNKVLATRAGIGVGAGAAGVAALNHNKEAQAAFVEGYNSVIRKQASNLVLKTLINPALGGGIGALTGMHKDTTGRSALTGAATGAGVSAGALAGRPIMGMDASRGLEAMGNMVRGSQNFDAEALTLGRLPAALERLQGPGGKARIIAAALAPLVGGIGAYEAAKQRR